MVARHGEQHLGPVVLKGLLIEPTIEFFQVSCSAATEPKVLLNSSLMIPNRLTSLRITVKIIDDRVDL